MTQSIQIPTRTDDEYDEEGDEGEVEEDEEDEEAEEEEEDEHEKKETSAIRTNHLRNPNFQPFYRRRFCHR